METLKIIWPLLLIGIVSFALCYIKMRERIPFEKRDRLEKILMILLIILLLVDIGFAINKRKIMTEQFNDCIRFYRYYPNDYRDSEFYFITKWCYDYFDEEEIKVLRESGRAWNLKQLEQGIFGGVYNE